MVNGWIIYTQEKFLISREYCQLYIDSFKCKGISISVILVEKLSIKLLNSKNIFIYEGRQVDKPSFVINRTSDFLLAELLEQTGIKVYNNSYISRVCNDKRLTYSLVANNGIEILDTSIITAAEDEIFSYPYILKDSFGSGGSGVFLVNNSDELNICKDKLKLSKLLYQKVAPEVGKDVRVYVVEKKIVAAVLRSSDTDFRSNFSLGSKASVFELNQKNIELVNSIINMFDFGMVGIDFLVCGNKLIFNEIEDCVGSRMLYKITDINIVDIYAQYIIEQVIN